MYIIGNTEFAYRVEKLFPEEVATELIRGSAVLDSDYGENRNYMENGGYALVIDCPSDLPSVEHFIHYRTHPCEWATRLGNSGYLSALYIADNDFVIMLYMPSTSHLMRSEMNWRIDMKVTKTNLITEAVFSEDRTKRYLLHKTWDETKPSLCIILLAPSEADLITLDNTTQLVLNNAVRLGYGGVYIWNLFSRLNDFHLRNVDTEDPENLQVLRMVLDKVDTVVYAPGVGKAKNQYFLARQEQVVKELQPYETKLKCLCDAEGKARLQHPLSPAVRVWYLSKLSLQELSRNSEEPAEKKESRRGSPKKVQQEVTPSEG